MQFENMLKCHRTFLPLITEEDVLQCGCVSIVDEDTIEQMIFLGKDDKSKQFEVRVYKANPEDTYVPHVLDFKLKRYTANDKFASFFFDTFFFARRFICMLESNHPEYSVRPIQKAKS